MSALSDYIYTHVVITRSLFNVIGPHISERERERDWERAHIDVHEPFNQLEKCVCFPGDVGCLISILIITT